jgi:hypothetical protein
MYIKYISGVGPMLFGDGRQWLKHDQSISYILTLNVLHLMQFTNHSRIKHLYISRYFY